MRDKGWTLVVVCTATFMLLLDITIVTVALPDAQRELGAGFSAIQWVIDAYALSLAALLLVSGALADRYGRRLLFLIGLATFTAASALCGAAQDSAMLIASRAIQGVGGAILFATSLALLAVTFHGRERGTAFGIWGAVSGAATALGPIVGGALTSGISWRWVFWVNLPVGIAAITVTMLRVGESRSPHAARPDWPGFGTFTAALVALVYGLVRAGETGWSHATAISCFALAASLLTCFAIIESRVAHPMLDLSLLRVPAFLGASAAAFAMNASLFAMFVYLVLYLQSDLGYSALGAGTRLLIITGATMLIATFAGRVSDRVQPRWLIGPGLALVGAGLLLMRGIHADSSWTTLIPGFAIAGVGSGMVNPPLASAAVSVVAAHRAGMAAGINTTFRQIGIAVGIAVYGTMFSAALRDHHAAGHHVGYAAAMNNLLLAAAIVALTGAAASLLLLRHHGQGPANQQSNVSSSRAALLRPSRPDPLLDCSEVGYAKRMGTPSRRGTSK